MENKLINSWAKNLYRHFTKEDIQVFIKHVNIFSISEVMRGMKIKTTEKYHYITKMAKI